MNIKNIAYLLSNLVVVVSLLVGWMTPLSVLVHPMLVENMLVVGLMTPPSVVSFPTDPAMLMWMLVTFAAGSWTWTETEMSAQLVLASPQVVGNLLGGLETTSSVLVHLLIVENMLIGLMALSSVLLTVYQVASLLNVAGVMIVAEVMIVVTGPALVMIVTGVTVFLAAGPALVRVVTTFATGPRTVTASQPVLVVVLVVNNVLVGFNVYRGNRSRCSGKTSGFGGGDAGAGGIIITQTSLPSENS